MFSVDDDSKIEFSPGSLMFNANYGYCFLKTTFSDDADNTLDRGFDTLFGIEHKVVRGEETSVLYPFGRESVGLEVGDIEFPPTVKVPSGELLNVDNEHKWRLLKAKEWNFLLKKRSAAVVCGTKNARFLLCTICGQAGLLLFPDNYVHPDEVQLPKNVINNSNSQFRRVTFNSSDWNKFEMAGCSFLPASGFGKPNGLDMYYGSSPNDAMEVNQVGAVGCYWTESRSLNKEGSHGCFVFGDRKSYGGSDFGVVADKTSWYINSVRLVRNVNSVADTERQNTDGVEGPEKTITGALIKKVVDKKDAAGRDHSKWSVNGEGEYNKQEIVQHTVLYVFGNLLKSMPLDKAVEHFNTTANCTKAPLVVVDNAKYPKYKETVVSDGNSNYTVYAKDWLEPDEVPVFVEKVNANFK